MLIREQILNSACTSLSGLPSAQGEEDTEEARCAAAFFAEVSQHTDG